MTFSMKDSFSKCDQICSFLWIWSHLLKKSLMGNFIFCAVINKADKIFFLSTMIRSSQDSLFLVSDFFWSFSLWVSLNHCQRCKEEKKRSFRQWRTYNYEILQGFSVGSIFLKLSSTWYLVQRDHWIRVVSRVAERLKLKLCIGN